VIEFLRTDELEEEMFGPVLHVVRRRSGGDKRASRPALGFWLRPHARHRPEGGRAGRHGQHRRLRRQGDAAGRGGV